MDEGIQRLPFLAFGGFEMDAVSSTLTRSPVRNKLARQLDCDPAVFETSLFDLDTQTSVGAGTPLYREGAAEEKVYALQSGWAIGGVRLADGRRYVHRIYLGGDVIGLEDINWPHATTTVEVVEDALVTSALKEDLVGKFETDPALAAVLFKLAMLDQVLVMDRARSNARLKVDGRLAHLMLSMEQLMHLSDDIATGGWFRFPLTQSQVGDALGVTSVHANRAFRQLREDGVLERRNRHYRIADRIEARRRGQWIDRFASEPDAMVATQVA